MYLNLIVNSHCEVLKYLVVNFLTFDAYENILPMKHYDNLKLRLIIQNYCDGCIIHLYTKNQDGN